SRLHAAGGVRAYAADPRARRRQAVEAKAPRGQRGALPRAGLPARGDDQLPRAARLEPGQRARDLLVRRAGPGVLVRARPARRRAFRPQEARLDQQLVHQRAQRRGPGGSAAALRSRPRRRHAAPGGRAVEDAPAEAERRQGAARIPVDGTAAGGAFGAGSRAAAARGGGAVAGAELGSRRHPRRASGGGHVGGPEAHRHLRAAPARGHWQAHLAADRRHPGAPAQGCGDGAYSKSEGLTAYLAIVINLDPNLFRVGPFLITWHGVFAVLGILAAARLGLWLLGKDGVDTRHAGDGINGEHHGTPTSAPWGVEYVNPSTLGQPGQIVHPEVAYEMVLTLAILGLLLPVHQRLKAKLPNGVLGLIYLSVYAAGRFFLSFYRTDPSVFLGMRQ